MLRLKTLTFEDKEGKKVEVDIPEGYQLQFKKVCPDEKMAATFLSGAILIGAVSSTKEFRSDNAD